MPSRIIRFWGILSIILIPFNVVSQSDYVYPKDTLVQKNLEKWQDLKFGLIMHWGLYSQIGVVESWGLCSEDQPFQDRNGMNYTDYKDMYFGLIKKFNPQKFDPDKWADAAYRAGMKYVIFTTKHHDGFCMFDTKQTNFKVTDSICPFHTNPKANVAKYVFESFRNRGFMVGAYFSKPDWHSSLYWTPLLATPNRNCNYDVRKYPDRWNAFQNYTYNQIDELTSEYGKIDILWLDGGWIRPDSTINDEVRSWGYDIPKWEQDINMPRIAAMVRKNQPGILIVDRTVHGPYEDYRTPEQSVPETALPYPFESNMTMTQNWGFVFNPEYKSTQTIINTLIDIVSKGGNLLLNVAPTPDGEFEDVALDRLSEIGNWMKINGEAIYSTRKWSTFNDGNNVRFTQSKDGRYLYVFVFDWSENTLKLNSVNYVKGMSSILLGSKSKIRIGNSNGKLVLYFPKELQNINKRPTRYASVFRVSLH